MNLFRSGTRKEKDGSSHKRQKSRDKSAEKKTRQLSSDGIISLFKSDPQKKLDKEQSAKVQSIRHLLDKNGFSGIDDGQINYALLSKHAGGDIKKAYDLVILFQESVEGLIKPYSSAVRMKGAENRELVTCWLDAVLFAMFARLPSFEPILYTQFDDEPRRRLATLIRLWVNMMRTGMLIQTDITQHLQEAIAACGWDEAADSQQHDSSEAFSFLTEKLQLPLLNLKMDLFHSGAEDAKDDHKIIQERMLEVAVPDQPSTLEECLENYFNNRVEVVRKLERPNTISSVRSARSPSTDKGTADHVEVAVREVAWSTPNTPLSPYPQSPLSPGGRHRTDSIIRTRVHELQSEEKGESSLDSDAMSTRKSIRRGSTRKEVMMPAFQFFHLLPWYTGNQFRSLDSDIIEHVSNTQPVLGICLKRYAMSVDGQATRKNTPIDIPIDMRLPHFLNHDGSSIEGGPAMENFKLSLQSIICHRGISVTSGHYISVVRVTSEAADGDFASPRRLSHGSRPPHYSADRWIKHDDLAAERVSYVEIEDVLRDEMPYLLFYQIQPIYEMSPPNLEPEPPAYEQETTIDVRISESSPLSENKHDNPFEHDYFGSPPMEELPAPGVRFSSEIGTPRHSVSLSDDRRGSSAPTETSLGSTASSIRVPRSNPVTPTEETTTQRLSRAASRFKSGSRSRPTSASGENRISATFSRLALRSKEQVHKGEQSKDSVTSMGSMSTSTIPSMATSTDGAAESRGASSVMLDFTLKQAEDMPRRSISIRGRKRDKSKDPSGKLEKVENGHHHHHHSHKSKASKDFPDRECTIM